MPVSLNEWSALVVVTGDGAVEVTHDSLFFFSSLTGCVDQMDLSTHNWKHAPSVPGKEQLIPTIFAKALETIPQQVCDDNMEAFVPLVELNAIGSTTEATCLILDVDETVRNSHNDAVRKLLSFPFQELMKVNVFFCSKVQGQKHPWCSFRGRGMLRRRLSRSSNLDADWKWK